MNILYDHQTFSLQEYGGISRVYTELLKPDMVQNKYQANLSLLFSNNHYLPELNKVQYYPFFSGTYLPRKVQIMSFLNKQKSIYQLKKQAFDIFHPTYYDPYFLKYLKDKPFVVTFLDMIHERFGGQFPELAQDKKIYSDKKIVLEEANTIIAISESTKNDLVEFFNIDASKINVVYLATSLLHNTSMPIVKEQYLLFVGRRERYKNFLTLIKALRPLLQEYTYLKLICAGGGLFTDEEKAILKKMEIDRQVVQLAFSSDDVLTNLYSNAVAFIFPSLYEGFGIPVLEAFACKCPVIVSNVSSLPEVADNAAAYINPNDEQSIFSVIKKVIDDEMYRKELVQAGIERNQFFSWQKNRNETEQLYQKLIA